ncbi:hypothetical protein F4808DRAFT_428657 [Astrocystis sublimbata]|nr:hypothetical protein F4808DRAFT_428657 [Astrocystis sublimbata]
MATTTVATLPADWVPTLSGCLKTEDFWIWSYSAPKDARTVLGGPSQTTNCFASVPWSPTSTWAGSGCPAQYTSACQDDHFSVVTCCPSLYNFTCQAQTTAADHLSMFRCVSAYTDQKPITVTLTDLQQNPPVTQTRSKRTDQHLFALALMYTTPPPGIPSPTSPSSTTTSESSQATTEPKSSGLTAGASAGIGIGAAAAVILLALLGWFTYRRRRAPKPSSDMSQYPTSMPPSMPPSSVSPNMTETSRGASPNIYGQPATSQQPKELPTTEERRYELEGNNPHMQQN